MIYVVRNNGKLAVRMPLPPHRSIKPCLLEEVDGDKIVDSAIFTKSHTAEFLKTIDTKFQALSDYINEYRK